VKLLAFSDLHCDLAGAAELVERSSEADVVIGAGDFASMHEGLTETIEALAPITKPAILVPGNNETEDELRAAAAAWPSARVLHREGAEVEGIEFWGVGGGIPVTPWDWSFDLTEGQARESFVHCPDRAVFVLHSPPQGHCDEDSSGRHLGSVALGDAIADFDPRLAVCGHIHESWGARSVIGRTEIANLGPAGAFFEV
jgi:Icc-related predicted phosphoesterase